MRVLTINPNTAKTTKIEIEMLGLNAVNPMNRTINNAKSVTTISALPITRVVIISMPLVAT